MYFHIVGDLELVSNGKWSHSYNPVYLVEAEGLQVQDQSGQLN